MHSYWEQKFWNKKFDFAIVGAGFTGLNVALNIKKKYTKAKVLVIDKDLRFSVASTKNAGFACFGSPSEFLSDIEKMGEEKATQFLKKRQQGIELIAKEYSARCDHTSCISHEWFLDEELFEKCLRHLDALNDLTKSKDAASTTYRVGRENILPKGVRNEILIEGEGQLNPYKLHEALLTSCRDVNIELLSAEISTYDEKTLFTSSGLRLESEIIINCSNALSKKLFDQVDVRPARAQVLITKEIENLPYNGNYHMDEGFYYFRNVGKRLLLGGARNEDFEAESTDILGLNSKISQKLEETLQVLLGNKDFEVEQRWSGIMGFTENKQPNLSKQNGVHHLVGMSGMGVALAFSISRDLVNQLD
ncbi:MAG: FAD-binding oxidoreductase [Bacteroidia bacterium]